MEARNANRPEVRKAGASTGTITSSSDLGYEYPSVRAASTSVKSKSERLASTVRVTYGSVMTTWPMRRLRYASRSPISRRNWRRATPTTNPGIISGETMKVTSAVLPGNVPRVTAIAQSVPSPSEMAVDTAAIPTERRTAGQSSRRRSIRSYQLDDSAGGGRLKTDDALTETASVTARGARRVRTTAAVTVHIATTAARSSIMGSAARLPASREQRARDHHRDRDQEQHHGRRRAHGPVSHEQE